MSAEFKNRTFKEELDLCKFLDTYNTLEKGLEQLSTEDKDQLLQQIPIHHRNIAWAWLDKKNNGILGIKDAVDHLMVIYEYLVIQLNNSNSSREIFQSIIEEMTESAEQHRPSLWIWLSAMLGTLSLEELRAALDQEKEMNPHLQI